MLEQYLRQRLYRFDCPALEILLDYYWKHLPAGERRGVERHLKACPHCEDELAELTRLATLEQSQAREAPFTWREHIQIAVAQFLTPQSAMASALRGATGKTSMFDAGEGWLVSLNVELAPDDSRTLLGQVLSPAPQLLVGAHARLRLAEQITQPYETAFDEAGAFALSQLPAGDYQLRLTLPDRLIIIPSITL